MNKTDHTKKPLSRTSEKYRPGLYLLATPIGNLRDITLRALDLLESCDAVLCEDTRVTGGLLSAFGLKKEKVIYNDHAADRQRDMILQRLQQGQVLALVSDAGTPLVSDPGYKLVRAALEKDIYVTALPGACAPVMALQLSALPSDSFSFMGFLPPKTVARKAMLERWGEVPGTLVAFETAPRLVESLRDIYSVLGDRPACVMREMTKMYEEGVRAHLGELIVHYEKKGPPKGEIVVVIGGSAQESNRHRDIVPALRKAMELLGTKQASQLIAEIYDRPKKEVYALALELSS